MEIIQSFSLVSRRPSLKSRRHEISLTLVIRLFVSLLSKVNKGIAVYTSGGFKGERGDCRPIDLTNFSINVKSNLRMH